MTLSGLLTYLLDMVAFIAIYGIVAVSLNLEYGFTGLSNFGKVAFVMIGAYTTAILAHLGVSFWLCIPASAAIAAVFGFLVSLPALRLREDYLAIVTLTFGEILRTFIEAQGIGGGKRGISVPQIFHFDSIVEGRLANIGLAAVFLALCFVFAQLVANSPYGRIMRAIREDQTAAQSYGKSIQRYKSQVFAMGSAVAGIAGALLAQYTGHNDPESFLPGLTFTFWIMVMLGGPGNNWGVVLGVAVGEILDYSARILKDYIHLPVDPANIKFIVYGILILLVLFYRPGGLIKESPVKPPKLKEPVNV
jgi:branched-chain amino acid transport system permease protein